MEINGPILEPLDDKKKLCSAWIEANERDTFEDNGEHSRI